MLSRLTYRLIPVALAILLAGSAKLWAQVSDDLFLIDQETEIRRVTFSGNETFDHFTLEDQIVSRFVKAWPKFFDRLTFWNKQHVYFNPVELQKDVARLRRFYNRMGFLETSVDYNVIFDQDENNVHTQFQIDEGPPLLILDIQFLSPDGQRAAVQFEGEDKDRWIDFRQQNVSLSSGDRFSEFESLRIQDRITTWLRAQGYAFAEVSDQVDLDVIYNVVDLQYIIDAGPPTTVGKITIEGERSVEDNVVLRELPFQEGDRFNYKSLVTGQRDLFGLDLFRYAIAELPPQNPDSTVDILIRLEQAKETVLRAETGYATTDGVNLKTEFLKRNFMGAARKLSLQSTWKTGLYSISSSGIRNEERQEVSLSLLQPFLFNRRTSLIAAPFYTRLFSSATQGQEFGFKSTLIYDIHQFRNVSLLYTFARAKPFSGAFGLNPDIGTGEQDLIRFYNKSILRLSGDFGKKDNYLAPEDGFGVRPFIEFAGGIIASDVEYLKTGIELTRYQPIGNHQIIAGRLYGGHIMPFGKTSTPSADATDDERFDTIRFYSGGPNDVRGWVKDGLGIKTVVQDSSVSSLYRYEPEGGLSKISGNLEFRSRIPRLSSNWQGVVFFDFGQVREKNLSLKLSDFNYGTGMGIRFKNPLGYLRFDLGYKLNPFETDINSARSINDGIRDSDSKRFLRRFEPHISIGHAF